MMTQKAQLELGKPDDVILVRSAKQGDMTALEELVRRNTGMVLRIAMHIAGSRDAAEDVAQAAFCRAFQLLPHFEEASSFSAWLTRIAIDEALAKLRHPEPTAVVCLDDEVNSRPLAYELADWKFGPRQSNRAQLRKALQRALESLPYAHRIVFLMRDVEGISTKDVAELLGMNIPDVKARLLRARLKLRDVLSAYFAGPPEATTSLSPPEQALKGSHAA